MDVSTQKSYCFNIFKRCCFFLLLFNFLIVAILGLATLTIVFILKPQNPIFSLQTINLDSFQLHSTDSGSTLFVSSLVSVTLNAQNPNKVGIKYSPSTLHALYEGAPIGKIRVPGFYQPAHSKNVSVRIKVLLPCVNVSQLIDGPSLQDDSNDKSNIVQVRILGDVIAQVLVFRVTLPKLKVNFWPYGETFFKYPTGRFSDGRIIPDFIAEYAKLPLIQPYQQPVNHQFDFGANFASGGAGALDETNQGMVINLNTQLRNFEKVENVLRQKFGDKEARKMLLNAVYLFSIGSNDYVSPQITNSTIYQSLTQEQYVEMVIGNLTAVINEIYKKGGRKFVFINLGPLGCLPLLQPRLPRNTSGCLEEVTALVKLHNSALSKVLQKLEKQFKGFKFSNFNFYLSFSERMDNPSKYGFKVGNSVCCGSGPNRSINSCGGKRGIKEYELCDDPSEYVFFDPGHPTEMANHQFAMLMWSGTPNVTGPYNLKSLFEHTQGRIS